MQGTNKVVVVVLLLLGVPSLAPTKKKNTLLTPFISFLLCNTLVAVLALYPFVSLFETA